MRLSVIIPVFNGGKYLRNLLDSLDLLDSRIEYIVVNDGSTDNTGSILNIYKDNINIYNIPNGGVSRARNYGLNKSTGDFVTFVDADDSIPKKTFSYYLELIQQNCEVDCIQGAIISSKSDKCYLVDPKILRYSCLGYPRVIHKDDGINSTIKASAHGCYGKVYRRKFLVTNNLMFNEKMGLGEDLLFYYNVLCTAKKVIVSEKQTYIINSADGSSTRRFNPDMPQYAIQFANQILSHPSLGSEPELFSEACYQINMHVNVAVLCYYAHINNPDSLMKRAKQFKLLLGVDSVQIAYNNLFMISSDFKHKIKYFLLKSRMGLLYLILNK